MPTNLDVFLAPARPRAEIWRTLTGLLGIVALYLAGMFALLAVYALASGATGDPLRLLGGDRPENVLMLLGTYAPLALAVWAVTRFWHRRGLASLFGPGWLPEFLRAVLAMAIVLAIMTALTPDPFAGSEPNLPFRLWLLLLLPALALTMVQTLSEELVFRAYLMQQLGARFRSPVIWFVLPAILFGAAHISPRLLGAAWPVVVGSITIFALVMGDLTRRHGNIGAAWGLHLMNNLYILLVITPEGPLTGIALFIRSETVSELILSPVMLLMQVLPYLVLWVILRRPLPR